MIRQGMRGLKKSAQDRICDMEKVKSNYRYVICFTCFWLFLCNMGLCSNILTVYLPFIEEKGLTDSMGSAILSVRSLFSFLTTFLVEIMYRKISLRRGILLASLAGAAAPVLFGIGTLPVFYYIGAALAGIAYAAGSVYPVSLLISNWFTTHKGLALGISSAGSGIATMLFAPLISGMILQHSLHSAFVFQSLFQLISACAVFILVRDHPEGHKIPDNDPQNRKELQKEDIYGKALPASLLAMLAVMMLLNGGAGLAFSGHLSVLAVSSGYSEEIAAAAVSVFGFTLFAGKMAAGWLADRFGTKNSSILLISVFVLGCLAVLGMNGQQVFWCILLSAMLGFGASIYNVGPPLWAADLSSREHYGKTLRWLQIFYNLGGIIFTIVPGIIADFTSEYKSSYLLFAGMMIVSMTMLLRAYKVRRQSARS